YKKDYECTEYKRSGTLRRNKEEPRQSYKP
ncbi:unnamed protein product, partial [marine sediment metagenome]